MTFIILQSIAPVKIMSKKKCLLSTKCNRIKSQEYDLIHFRLENWVKQIIKGFS